jgi:hypothetical protein
MPESPTRPPAGRPATPSPTEPRGPAARERDRELDQDLKDTFPASDPVPPKHVD